LFVTISFFKNRQLWSLLFSLVFASLQPLPFSNFRWTRTRPPRLALVLGHISSNHNKSLDGKINAIFRFFFNWGNTINQKGFLGINKWRQSPSPVFVQIVTEGF